MQDIAPIIGRLGRAHVGLEAAARMVPEPRWREATRPGVWSAAEVVAHVTMVERQITAGAAKLLAGAPPHLPIWKWVHLPVALAAWRGIRVKSRIPLDPSLVADREEMLARLTEERKRTLVLLQDNRQRDLKAYRFPHPFFGSLNLCDWFKVLAYHEVRHTQQIREIVDSFRS